MISPETPTPSTNVFGGATPVLRVESARLPIDYYLSVLGFKLEWEFEGFFACVSRNQCRIFLCAGDQGHPGTWVWIGVTDAAALEAEYQASGAKIRHPPTNYPWAYEMQVEDLDSNVLRFGSDPISGQQFGDWLDMNGRSWPVGADDEHEGRRPAP